MLFTKATFIALLYVSSGTLNSTIPYHTIPYYMFVCVLAVG